jgi:hypothetical protein
MQEGKKKQFFFEKKNQKTFICCCQRKIQHGIIHVAQNRQKFFGSFFQKRTACFLSFLSVP